MATVQRCAVAASLLAPFALAGCSFSFNSGGPDYEKLESAITDELNSSYTEIGREVTTVECPRQDDLAAGDSFVCTATVDDEPVRVEVNVKDDDYNVDFTTLDIVFDLPMTASGLEQEISADQGFPVTVDCGEGIEVVAVGGSFECTALNDQGDTVGVEVTAGAVGEQDSWRLVE